MSLPIDIIPRTKVGNPRKPVIVVFDYVINSLQEKEVKEIGETYDGNTGWLSGVFGFRSKLALHDQSHRDS